MNQEPDLFGDAMSATPLLPGVANTQNSPVSGPGDRDFKVPPQYTDTVAQASMLMRHRHCKYHSERKVQRLCQSGELDCYRLQTKRDGKPVTEWLVNRGALFEQIKNEPKLDEPGATVTPLPSGVASSGTESAEAVEKEATATSTVASPTPGGVASDVGVTDESVDDASDAIVTPLPSGVASGRRTAEAQALVDNAALMAEVRIKDELIAELRDDKGYMRQLIKNQEDNQTQLQANIQKLAGDAIDVSKRSLQAMNDFAAMGATLKAFELGVQQNGQTDGSRGNGEVEAKIINGEEQKPPRPEAINSDEQ